MSLVIEPSPERIDNHSEQCEARDKYIVAANIFDLIEAQDWRSVARKSYINPECLCERTDRDATVFMKLAQYDQDVAIIIDKDKHPTLATDRDADGNTVLLYAVMHGAKNVIRIMRECFADFATLTQAKNNAGYTAAHLAALHNNFRITSYLHHYKFSLDEFDAEGKSPLVLAIENDCAHTVHSLLWDGCKIMENYKRIAYLSPKARQTLLRYRRMDKKQLWSRRMILSIIENNAHNVESVLMDNGPNFPDIDPWFEDGDGAFKDLFAKYKVPRKIHMRTRDNYKFELVNCRHVSRDLQSNVDKFVFYNQNTITVPTYILAAGTSQEIRSAFALCEHSTVFQQTFTSRLVDSRCYLEIYHNVYSRLPERIVDVINWTLDQFNINPEYTTRFSGIAADLENIMAICTWIYDTLDIHTQHLASTALFDLMRRNKEIILHHVNDSWRYCFYRHVVPLLYDHLNTAVKEFNIVLKFEFNNDNNVAKDVAENQPSSC